MNNKEFKKTNKGVSYRSWHLMKQLTRKNAIILKSVAAFSLVCLLALHTITLVHVLFHAEIPSNARRTVSVLTSTVLVLAIGLPFFDVYLECERRIYYVFYFIYGWTFHLLRYGHMPQWPCWPPMAGRPPPSMIYFIWVYWEHFLNWRCGGI